MHFGNNIQILPLLVLLAMEMSAEAKWYANDADVDVDKLSYFCGNDFGDMSSHFCQTFPRRVRRGAHSECCSGLGCSIRYVMENYCQVIKPECVHLFKNDKETDRDRTKPTSSLINAIKKVANANSESDEMEKTTHVPLMMPNVRVKKNEKIRNRLLFVTKSPNVRKPSRKYKESQPQAFTSLISSTSLSTSSSTSTSSSKLVRISRLGKRARSQSLKKKKKKKNKMKNKNNKNKKNIKDKKRCKKARKLIKGKFRCCKGDKKAIVKSNTVVGSDYTPSNSPVYHQAKSNFGYQLF